MVGGILSWAIMWPLIDARKGDWYSADLKSSSLHGLQGYKVSFLSTFTNTRSMFHGDQTLDIWIISFGDIAVKHI